MAKFTPFAYVPATVPSVVRRDPLMQQMFPTGQPRTASPLPHFEPNNGAAEPAFYADAFFDPLYNAVKKVTGSDAAAFAATTISPRTFGQVLRKAPQYLTEGQQIYRATKDPVNYQHSRRYDNPEFEFGTHVATDPKTSDFFVTEHGYDPRLLTMRSNVSRPIHVSDGRWEPGRVIERLIQENYDTLSEKTKADLLQVRNRYEHAAVSTGLSAAEQHRVMDRYAKETQRVLKKAGYDHISYINTIEGPPVESAILFDKSATTRPVFFKKYNIDKYWSEAEKAKIQSAGYKIEQYMPPAEIDRISRAVWPHLF